MGRSGGTIGSRSYDSDGDAVVHRRVPRSAHRTELRAVRGTPGRGARRPGAARHRATRSTGVVVAGLVAIATGIGLLLAPVAPIAARAGSVLGEAPEAGSAAAGAGAGAGARAGGPATGGGEGTGATGAPVRVAPGTPGDWAGPTVPTPVLSGFVPERLRVEALGVDSALLTTLVGADGALVPPQDPEDLGWWRGVRPGTGTGSVVIAGHVDSSQFGRGPLARLVDLAPGDRAILTGADGARAEYVVRGIETFAKRALPAADLFTAGGEERLVLVTCGGRFDRRHGSWDSNIVAVLDRVPAA